MLARQGQGAEDPLGSALRARWLLDSMSGVVALLTPDGATLELNRAALALAGVRREGMLGRAFWELPHWAPDGATAALLRSAVTDAAAGTATSVEAQLTSGAILLVELRPLVGNDGGIRLVMAEGRDVTELHALTERLRAANARRREFVEAFGHDLQSPLAVLLALTRRAQADPELIAAPRDALDGIDAAARALADQVDHLLNAARESDGAIEPSLAEEDLAHIVREGVQGLSALAYQRGIRVEVAAPPTVAVRADRRRLASMVVNLVHNALRYADAVVEVRLEADGPLARLTIADDGPGVPERLREEVFERFSQGEGVHGVGAVGLGLSIVRDIVTLHGGTIRLGTGERHGAEFTVDLPRVVRAVEPAEAPVAHRAVAPGVDPFEAVPVGLGIVGADGAWRRVNGALCTLLARDAAEMVGRDAGEHLPATLRGPLRRLLAGEARVCEVEQRVPGGPWDRLVLWTASVARTADGFVVCARELAPRPARRPDAAAHGGGPQGTGPPASRPRQGGTHRSDGSGVAQRAARSR